MHSFQTICTGLHNFYVDWTNSGELLAVAGKVREIANKADHTIRYINVIHFYDENGHILDWIRFKQRNEKNDTFFFKWRQILDAIPSPRHDLHPTLYVAYQLILAQVPFEK